MQQPRGPRGWKEPRPQRQDRRSDRGQKQERELPERGRARRGSARSARGSREVACGAQSLHPQTGRESVTEGTFQRDWGLGFWALIHQHRTLASDFFPSASFPHAPSGQAKTQEIKITNQRELRFMKRCDLKGSHFCLFISHLSDTKTLDLFDYDNMGRLQSLCTIVNSKCSEKMILK